MHYIAALSTSAPFSQSLSLYAPLAAAVLLKPALGSHAAPHAIRMRTVGVGSMSLLVRILFALSLTTLLQSKGTSAAQLNIARHPGHLGTATKRRPDEIKICLSDDTVLSDVNHCRRFQNAVTIIIIMTSRG